MSCPHLMPTALEEEWAVQTTSSSPCSSRCTYRCLHRSFVLVDNVQTETRLGASGTRMPHRQRRQGAQGNLGSDASSSACRACHLTERMAFPHLHCKALGYPETDRREKECKEPGLVWEEVVALALDQALELALDPLERAPAESWVVPLLCKTGRTSCRNPRRTWESPYCSRACGKRGKVQLHHMCPSRSHLHNEKNKE